MWLITIFISLLSLFVYYKFYLPNQFWKKRGIPYVQPSLLFGNLTSATFRQKTFAEIIKEAYKQFESHRYFGFYQFVSPCLVVSDTELIKQICIKHFDCFTDRPDFLPGNVDPFWKKALQNLEGKDWHDMRSVLSPVFTTRKMRRMFNLVHKCAENFVNHFANETGVIKLEMRDVFNRFTSDATASCAYGIQCDSFQNKNNEFFMMGQEAFDFSGWKSIRFFGSKLNHQLMKILGITFFSSKIQQFFLRICKESIQYREETGVVNPDLIHLLKEAQKGRLEFEEEEEGYSGFAALKESDSIKYDRSKKTPITDEDIAIQALLFFFGGYDTVSIGLCQLVYELTVNADTQEKLLTEIDTTLLNCNGKITYDVLLKMKYLDMCIAEILRLWPPATVLLRLCVKPFVIEPILSHEKQITITPGTEILIPSVAIHTDPKYFDNPDKYNPERFSDGNKDKINPYAYHAFGVGPRHCIGNRFALMTMKIVMFSLLSRFQIVPIEKTVIPFIQSKNSILIRSKYDYWFGLKRRSTRI